MKKLLSILLCFCLLVSCNIAFAKNYKDESVFAFLDNTGKIKSVKSSVWLKNFDDADTLVDKSDLKDIQNVKGNEDFSVDGDKLSWNSDKKDIYYSGVSEKELPVSLDVKYYLEDVETKPEDMLNKTGHVKVVYNYKNSATSNMALGNENLEISVPFVAVSINILDTNKFKNIKVSNGEILSDGKRAVVVGTVLPGLMESLNVNSENNFLSNSLEIEADVEEFQMSETYVLSSNKLFNDISLKMINETMNKDDMTKLSTAGEELSKGASGLYDGLDKLNTNSESIAKALSDIEAGLKGISDSSSQIEETGKTINGGLEQYDVAMEALSKNNEFLNKGMEEFIQNSVDMINATAKNLKLKKLDINGDYQSVLNKAIISSDKTNVYKGIIEKINSDIETKKDYIKQEIIKKAFSNYDENALASKEVQAQINSMLNIQIAKTMIEAMNDPEVQKALSNLQGNAKSLLQIKTKMDSLLLYKIGFMEYTNTVSNLSTKTKELKDGISQYSDAFNKVMKANSDLYSGMSETSKGFSEFASAITQLKDGSKELSDGITQASESISKSIKELFGTDNIMAKINMLIEASKAYNSFSGISDDMDGSVKFIYKIDPIK